MDATFLAAASGAAPGAAIAFSTCCACFVPATLMLIGVVSGYLVEQSHLRHLAVAEAELRPMIVTDTQALPEALRVQFTGNGGELDAELVYSSVVLSVDHFRTFVTSLRKLIGGELTIYSRLATRARREALVRLLNEARQRGAPAVINVRFETSNILGVVDAKKKRVMVEVLAYGTAIRARRP